MTQRKLAGYGLVCLLSFTVIVLPTRTRALPLDKDGEIKLGVSTYVAARIGTEATNFEESQDAVSLTFPRSPAGHLRQNRFYLEAELDHDLERLTREGFGPLALFNHLPFRIKGLKYHMTFRGEGDGIYDWGPREYSTAAQYQDLEQNPISADVNDDGTCTMPPGVPQGTPCHRAVDVPGARRRLRDLGTHRERLFQAYVEASVPTPWRGPLFMRLGRQIWSWGETDSFQLLDHINPIDSSFGGFLVPLDERRVALDMARLEYRIGDLGPLQEVAIQGYGAIDNKVGFQPAGADGASFSLPNSKPGATTENIIITPKRTFHDIRGGGRLVGNALDATFSVAHYYTYFDIPAVQPFVVCGDATCPKGIVGHQTNWSFPFRTFPDGYSARALETAPLVQITGATTTFPIEKLYTIVRSEFAYFKDEPRFAQSHLDPFIWRFQPNLRHVVGPVVPGDPSKGVIITSERRLGDSINYVLGFDINQYIRALNPNQTFFFSTQFFYKHLMGAAPRGATYKDSPGVVDGEVLPVARTNISWGTVGKFNPSYIHQPTDTFLQTLFISTSYMSGQVNPFFVTFYDWGGAVVFVPGVTLSRDPWRFTIEYDYLDSGPLKGGSGVSLFKDRDNVLFELKYAI